MMAVGAGVSPTVGPEGVVTVEMSRECGRNGQQVAGPSRYVGGLLSGRDKEKC